MSSLNSDSTYSGLQPQTPTKQAKTKQNSKEIKLFWERKEVSLFLLFVLDFP